MYRITFALNGPHVGRGVCLATCAAKVVRGILVPIASEYDSSILSIASDFLFKVLMFDKQMFI